MQIRETEPLNLLYFQTRATIADLAGFVGTIANALYQDAAANALPVTGPVYWNYFGFAGDESAPFTLEIALPIAGLPSQYNGKYQVKQTSKFKCLSTTHFGGWDKIPETYGKLMAYIGNHHLKMTQENREIYINWDMSNPKANWTEIQIGIV